ncbi:LLM class flavin-dependent oxidoreductase [Luteipulveratus flavus]|uniref:LLM class flavin-dependent oxidoreductase n=1 Tax=Luteipulveratus flavus TaxID=3031728 RepID=A0ABT6C1D2_9MICO|nr:LLM class flavin-dependent oxidoreductase [Luteipulveratus sp. YIM 133296]MDF8262639.1 LLM class flavin-dependent oxidoreductase [Luteipulveratus sp. YIM 133296]
MRFGLELPCGGEQLSATDIVDMAVAAERAGWDGVFLEDYLVYYRGEDPPTYDPWVLLTAVAARTERLWLGTTVSGLLARDSVKLAREAATLDALAPGRVVLGVGLGDPQDRGVHVGDDLGVSGPKGRAMDRRLDLLLDLLAGTPVPARDGEPPVTFRPASGRVRVWVGGSTQARAVHRRAAKAHGVVPYKLTDVEQWSDFTREDVERLAAAVAAGTRAPPGTTSPSAVASASPTSTRSGPPSRRRGTVARPGGWSSSIPRRPLR